jgi:hypothetical protein
MQRFTELIGRQNYHIGCAICGKPLRLDSAKAGDDVLPMHEECYLLRLKLKQATMLSVKEAQLPQSRLPAVNTLPSVLRPVVKVTAIAALPTPGAFGQLSQTGHFPH